MSGPGLRLDQAPPFSVPLRFFLTAPVFPLIAAAVLAWQGPAMLASRWTPAMLALTHLFTLGFLAMVMIGALLQLLPVLAGSPVARPMIVSGGVHALLTLGTLVLSAGFLASHPAILRTGLVLLGGGFALFIAAAALSLARAGAGNAVVGAMRLALAALLVTVSLGLGLGMLLSAGSAGTSIFIWTDLHLGWGLVGWVGLLIIGVAYQVVPMFQLTPPYPAWAGRTFAPLVFVALLVWSTGAALAPEHSPLTTAARFVSVLPGLGLAVFAIVTLRLQRKRHRRLPDVTTRFWQLSMVSLLAAVVMGTAVSTGIAASPRLGLLAGVWMIVGFASCAIHGMLYKIVPFLAWLHLHEQNIRGVLPNMKEIMPDARTRPHVWIHGLALLLTSTAVMHPGFWVYPAAAAIALSYAWLGWNLLSAHALYRRLVKTAGAP